MSPTSPIVFVVDDDVSVRESLELLIRHEGLAVETFTSAQDFLARPRTSVPSCLVLDVSLPGLNGLDLQKRVAAGTPRHAHYFHHRPWGYTDDGAGDEGGAVEFLTKPFGGAVLLNAIRNAIERSGVLLGREAEMGIESQICPSHLA